MCLAQLKKTSSQFPDVDSGILVPEVAKGSPAERAGFQPGDVIVGFQGHSYVHCDPLCEDGLLREWQGCDNGCSDRGVGKAYWHKPRAAGRPKESPWKTASDSPACHRHARGLVIKAHCLFTRRDRLFAIPSVINCSIGSLVIAVVSNNRPAPCQQSVNLEKTSSHQGNAA